ncbi:FkbM family methyltransferase [Candidatus Pelagibacter ubique]|uniref:FkbM family methyltransferase n=1 Tax=Pelagibacter ubique TaxID=198252 RepID=UPI0003C7E3AE
MIKFLTLKILNIFDYFYQKKLINFLKKKGLNNLNILLDIGAHEGESIKLFTNNFNINEIYSFEPSPISFKILIRNITTIEDKFKKTKIFPENIALGSKHKKIFMKHISESSSSTIRELNTDSKYFKKKFFFLKNSNSQDLFKKIEVQQILLSDYIEKNNIKSVDFIKIDTEGYELEVLKGAKNILFKTKYILFEHHYDDMIVKNYFFSDIHKFLKDNNFQQIYKSKMPFRKTFEYIYQNRSFKL